MSRVRQHYSYLKISLSDLPSIVLLSFVFVIVFYQRQLPADATLNLATFNTKNKETWITRSHNLLASTHKELHTANAKRKLTRKQKENNNRSLPRKIVWQNLCVRKQMITLSHWSRRPTSDKPISHWTLQATIVMNIISGNHY